MRARPVAEVPRVREWTYRVETVVEKAMINTLIPALKDQGASDILELALAKIVH